MLSVITTTTKGSITSVQVGRVCRVLSRLSSACLQAVYVSTQAVGQISPADRSTPTVPSLPFVYRPLAPASLSACLLQAVYVPADDLTDPAPATTFAHLDATTVLSRSIAELGIYPAVDPLDSTSRMLDPRILGEGPVFCVNQQHRSSLCCCLSQYVVRQQSVCYMYNSIRCAPNRPHTMHACLTLGNWASMPH
jgi:hypothetical protein